MDIADEEVALEGPAILAQDSGNTTISLPHLTHLSLTAHLAPSSLDITDERIDDELATALQSPTALDVAAQAMGKGEQRQRLATQFHPHGSSRHHVDQQRVVEERCQVVVGIDLEALFHGWQLA